MNLPIIIHKNKNNYIAEVKALKWAWAVGNTPEEAKKELKWVTENGLSVLIDNGEDPNIKQYSYDDIVNSIKNYNKDYIISDIEINLELIKKLEKKERTNIMIKNKHKKYAKLKDIPLSRLINNLMEKEINSSNSKKG